MSDQKKVDAVSSAEMAARRRLAEPVAAMDRAAEREADKGLKVPPVAMAPPVEPSPAYRPYRVMLDPETQRLYTEVIDKQTGDVLLRIPPAYVPPEEELDGAATERREVEL